MFWVWRLETQSNFNPCVWLFEINNLTANPRCRHMVDIQIRNTSINIVLCTYFQISARPILLWTLAPLTNHDAVNYAHGYRTLNLHCAPPCKLSVNDKCSLLSWIFGDNLRVNCYLKTPLDSGEFGSFEGVCIYAK